MNEAERNYGNFNELLAEITSGVNEGIAICQDLNFEGQLQKLFSLKERLENHKFSVGIMGEFKRGKSTVINSLLGHEIVPSDVIPTSATVNRIRWAEEPKAIINFKDGSTKEVSVDELSGYVTKLTDDAEKTAATVEDAVVYYPCDLCKNGVEIVDTPGLNDDERMDKVSEEVLPSLDAIVMVIVPDAPFSQSEADFVRNKIMASDMGRIIFVLNKIDCVRKRDREKLIDSIKSKIKTSVLDKLAATYGEDSDDYKKKVEKIGEIKLYPISARDALDGKLDNDEELLEDSNIEEFETGLSKLLVEERGLIELVQPVNSLCNVINEAISAVEYKRESTEMSMEEFMKNKDAAIEEININRVKKEHELQELKNNGNDLYDKIVIDVPACYENLLNELTKYIDNYDIKADSIKNDKLKKQFEEQMSENLNKKLNSELTQEIEKLVVKIEKQVEEDTARAINVMNEICNDVSNIKMTTIDKKESFIDVVKNVSITGVTFGISKFVSGYKEYKESGLKGAVLEGAGTTATTMLGFALAAGAAASAAFLPACIVGGICGNFGGKALARIIAKKDTFEKDMAEIKQSMVKSISECIDNMKNDSAIEKWLIQATAQSYNQVVNALDQEAEQMLTNFESLLKDIQEEKNQAELQKQQTLKKLDVTLEKINKLNEALVSIKEKFDNK